MDTGARGTPQQDFAIKLSRKGRTCRLFPRHCQLRPRSVLRETGLPCQHGWCEIHSNTQHEGGHAARQPLEGCSPRIRHRARQINARPSPAPWGWGPPSCSVLGNEFGGRVY